MNLSCGKELQTATFPAFNIQTHSASVGLLKKIKIYSDLKHLYIEKFVCIVQSLN